MAVQSRDRVLDALERASMLYLRVLNDRSWPMRHAFVVLLQRHIRRLEDRLRVPAK